MGVIIKSRLENVVLFFFEIQKETAVNANLRSISTSMSVCPFVGVYFVLLFQFHVYKK